ncbi:MULTISPECIES: transcriptional regulator LeuO [Rahnella]|uniref:transcriptional regulator LeuO n=1 Tax=Rahnella TaxID=34037 RepID=UPI000EAED412|nr:MULTISPECIES: transcriptional regulator LeuO [Rahnella]MBU9863723.1 transcriptional regulator LeuO [Rahnella aceris]MQB53473.1 transcriptional regulator LeuO [Rahnella sp. RcJ3]RKT76016.1 LysR family transcriptional activator for leuABCD operon [Rahnella aquatilis]
MSDADTEIQPKTAEAETHLRNVDLNLLTVFDAVMQLQNITRAANMLGMSQPAVSNAVARLKVMFNDDLFVRFGRGIQPTMRARQLFGPIRQALQLVMNELPGAGFDPYLSTRQFNVAICSPLDKRFTSLVLNAAEELSPGVSVKLQTIVNDDIEHQLRYQNIEFVISYRKFERADFCNHALFNDELVLVAAQNHPRISPHMSDEKYLKEKHAVMMMDRFYSFSSPYYDDSELVSLISYQGTDLFSVMEIVSKSEMVALVPRWLAQANAGILNLSVIPLPWMKNTLTCYLSWHESSSKDKGNMWMKTLLSQCVVSL